jgi:hypothetical protein
MVTQGAQSSGSFEQRSTPPPSRRHAQPQQSAANVQRAPSATQLLWQRSVPVSSGAQTPPQQRSPKAQGSPAGRQQTLVPSGPAAQVVSGLTSVQQSAAEVQGSVRRTQSA